MAEQRTVNPFVVGSSPTLGAMTRDFDHKEGFIQPCINCELTEAYRGQWKSISLRLMETNNELEEDRNRWKRMFLQMYQDNAGVTDEMMWAYRKEKANEQ